MGGSWVANLGLSPDAWLLVTILACLSFFFKVSRFWSLRNLDLVLIFALTPGLMILAGNESTETWLAFVWLFVGSLLWIIRALVDLGVPRRPVLEPNLNASGMACLMVGILGLFMVEMITRPAAGITPPGARGSPGELDAPLPGEQPVDHAIKVAPVPLTMYGDETPRVILRRVLAMTAQVALVAGLVLVGWRVFDRPEAGLSAATCYLLLPYSRFGLVDCAQLVPSALIVLSVLNHQRPAVTGALLGLATGWMPACGGLLPLWAGYYGRRRLPRFVASCLVLLVCSGLVIWYLPSLHLWIRAVGVRTWAEAGVWPNAPPPLGPSFWTGIDPSYRLPVLVGYALLVVILAIFPVGKNLAELIALSTAVLAASQFWYLEAGGTLVLLYLPLVILMMFRPNLSGRPHTLRSVRLPLPP